MMKAATGHEPNIPTAVQAQLDAAMAEHAAMTGRGTPPPPTAEPPSPAPDALAETAVTDPVTGVPTDAAEDWEHGDPGDPSSFDLDAEADAGAPEPDGDAATWQQRYRVMKGKYDAEVPRMAAQIAQLEGTVRTLSAVLERLGPADADTAVSAPAAPGDELTDEQLAELVGDDEALQEFGAEHWRRVAKMARRMARTDSPDVRTLRDQVQSLRRQQTYTQLDALLPGWRQQNSDARFVKWLHETPEPRTGQAYVVLLSDALHKGDAAAIAAVFRDWPGYDQAQAAERRPSAPRVPIAQQVTVPPKGPRAPTVPAAHKRVWSQNEIMDAAKRLATGELTPARAKSLQAELDAAMAEGRIR